MKIPLPDYDYMFDKGSAEVKNGVLYMYKLGSLKEVMYKLTYLVYGSTECYFCHRKLRTSERELSKQQYFSKMTLDHLVPQEFGGITAPNNMRPTCSNCNSSKGNMYPDEFEVFRQFIGKKDDETRAAKEEFMKALEEKQKNRRDGNIESIPEEWICQETIRNIYVNICIAEPLGMEYYRQERFYKEHKRLPKPVILSENRFLLDGFNTIMLAKTYCIERIDVIVLENVYYKGLPE